MATSNQVTYKWYRYTTNSGGFRAVKLDATIGDDADFGFAAFNAADPVLPISGKRNHPRFVRLRDNTTGRIKRVPVGAADADALASDFTKALPVRGLGTTVTYTWAGEVPERIQKPGSIFNQDEHVTA